MYNQSEKLEKNQLSFYDAFKIVDHYQKKLPRCY